MSISTQPGGGASTRPQPSGLVDVIDTILDKGLVIDAYVRVSLVGIEVLTIDARIVVASVDTYLRFAEAVNRLDISQDKEGLPELGGPPPQAADAEVPPLPDADVPPLPEEERPGELPQPKPGPGTTEAA